MAATEEQNGHVEPLTPPTEKKMEVKDKYWLILQLIWLNLLILPYLLLEIYRKVFPPPGKSIKGQIVLFVASTGNQLDLNLEVFVDTSNLYLRQSYLGVRELPFSHNSLSLLHLV
ncbi:hypothetical protein J6590_037591 [Homalodisca vitripennis]|nr:hypothetical protein J6590_037591 [Homalodisca vitripennis]